MKYFSNFILLLLFAIPPCQATESSATLEQLQRKAARLELATRDEWHALLHYRVTRFKQGVKSAADDPRFFLARTGKTDPEAELTATLRAFFLPSKKPAQCRFPARYQWLKQQLRFRAKVPCPKLSRWLKRLNAHDVTLVFASAYLNSPSSMFGHTFLRLNTPRQSKKNPILAYTISYAANSGERENELLFAYRGIFGGYPGITMVQPYYEKIKLYNDFENRDLWEYHLNLGPGEVKTLLLHTWEVKDKRFDYYFFDENCAYRILALIDVARPGTKLISNIHLRAIPSDTVRLVMEHKLVKKVDYRPSSAALVKHKIKHLSKSEQQSTLQIANEALPIETGLKRLDPQAQARLLETSFAYTRYKARQDKAQKKDTETLSHQLLVARSKVSAKSGFSPIDPPTFRNDQGHKTLRFSLAGGLLDHSSFVSLQLRPAYHDMHDPIKGYLPGSELQFLDTQLRYYPTGKLQLEKLTAIAIQSLSARDVFFKPWSWKVSVGARRTFTPDGRPLVPYIAGGRGVTYEVAGGNLFGLASARFELDDDLPKGYDVGAGIDLGWSLQRDRLQTSLGTRFSHFFAGDGNHRANFYFVQSVTLTDQSSLFVRFQREKTYDQYHSDFEAGIRLYF